jgi:hypothetical protein
LKKSLGQPLPALIINYFVGVSAAFIYAVVSRVPLPTLAQASDTSLWGWSGGLFGAVYGLAAILLASQMGATTLTALVVNGRQNLSAGPANKALRLRLGAGPLAVGLPPEQRAQKRRTYMYTMNQLTIIGFTGNDAEAHYSKWHPRRYALSRH